MTKYIHSDGYVLTDEVVYKNCNEYVRLKSTGRLHKVYYNPTWRQDIKGYININGRRYFLDEFIRDDI